MIDNDAIDVIPGGLALHELHHAAMGAVAVDSIFGGVPGNAAAVILGDAAGASTIILPVGISGPLLTDPYWGPLYGAAGAFAGVADDALRRCSPALSGRVPDTVLVAAEMTTHTSRTDRAALPDLAALDGAYPTLLMVLRWFRSSPVARGLVATVAARLCASPPVVVIPLLPLADAILRGATATIPSNQGRLRNG